jgi:tRNA G18 (ribose-2'-O)-methylase SpoU
VLATDELRRSKPSRADFATRARNPITLVLDGVRQNYNLGAIFRLCDAFLVERLLRRTRDASQTQARTGSRRNAAVGPMGGGK